MTSAETSTSATDQQTNALVLKDQAGDYFLVPQAVVEQGRVPQERRAELEQIIAEGQDVQGYIGPLAIVVVAAEIGIGAAFFIGMTGPADYGTLKAIKPREQLLGGGAKPPR
jgi:hypothetical protein